MCSPSRVSTLELCNLRNHLLWSFRGLAASRRREDSRGCADSRRRAVSSGTACCVTSAQSRGELYVVDVQRLVGVLFLDEHAYVGWACDMCWMRVRAGLVVDVVRRVYRNVIATQKQTTEHSRRGAQDGCTNTCMSTASRRRDPTYATCDIDWRSPSCQIAGRSCGLPARR